MTVSDLFSATEIELDTKIINVCYCLYPISGVL
jgi:hypothetical protein